MILGIDPALLIEVSKEIQPYKLYAVGGCLLLWMMVRIFHPVYMLGFISGLPTKTVVKARAGKSKEGLLLGRRLEARGHNNLAWDYLQPAAAEGNQEALQKVLKLGLRRKPIDYELEYSWVAKLNDSEMAAEWLNAISKSMDDATILAWIGTKPNDRFLQYQAALRLFHTKRYDEALPLLIQSADDNPEALLLLGEMYSKGLGVIRDLASAIKYFQKANHEGVTDAKSRLTDLLEELSPEDLLRLAEEEERLALSRHLNLPDGTVSAGIMEEFGRLAGNKIANRIRKGLGISYDKALKDTMKHLNVHSKWREKTVAKESALITRWTQMAMESMSETERQELLNEMQTKAKQIGEKFAGPGAVGVTGLAIASAGFTPYLMATTALSSITSVVGVTLPFAAYTTLTTAMSMLAGPVGLVGVAGWVAAISARPDPERVRVAVLCIAGIRQRLLLT